MFVQIISAAREKQNQRRENATRAASNSSKVCLRWERVFDVNYLFIYVVYLYCYSSKDMHSRYAPPL